MDGICPFRRGGAAEPQHEAERRLVEYQQEKWNLVTGLGVREGGQGNESTVLHQESVLDPYNYAANSSLASYTALFDRKDFSSEC